VYRLEPGVEAGALGNLKVVANPGRDRVHLLLRARQRDARLQAPDRAKTVGVPVLVVVAETVRDPDVRLLLDVGARRKQQLEPRRQHPDDLRARTVRNALADDISIATVAPLPVVVAQDRRGRQGRRTLLGGCGTGRCRRRLRLRQPVSVLEIAAGRDRRPHQPEEVDGHDCHPNLLRRAVRPGQHLARRPERGHVVERASRAIADVDEVLVRERHAEVVAGTQVHVHDDEALGILVGKRPQQHGVGDAEDGGAGGDAQPDGDRRCERKHRAAPQRAKCEREVVERHGTRYTVPGAGFNWASISRSAWLAVECPSLALEGGDKRLFPCEQPHSADARSVLTEKPGALGGAHPCRDVRGFGPRI
jgi:hypothetical protein